MSYSEWQDCFLRDNHGTWAIDQQGYPKLISPYEKNCFCRICLQGSKNFTEQTRSNLVSPWFISSLMPGLEHLTAMLILFLVSWLTARASRLSKACVKKGILRVKYSIYVFCQDFAVFQIYGCIFRQRILKITLQPS